MPADWQIHVQPLRKLPNRFRCLDAFGNGLGTANNLRDSLATAKAFTDRLERAGVAVSMDGRGRWMDNVFVERLWRTVKYEHLYLHDYATPRALEAGLSGCQGDCTISQVPTRTFSR